MEFLTTYSFAIFTISLVLIAAVTISFSVGTNAPVYSSCSIQPLITCQQSLLTYNSVGGYFNYVLVFRNNLGFGLQFPANSINLTLSNLISGASTNNLGKCAPYLAASGSQIICNVKVVGKSQVKQGANTYTQFKISYGLCTNQSVISCSANSYLVTGYSFQTLSPPFTNLYNVTIASPNGIVVINDEPYLNNTVVPLTSGSYTVSPQPNANTQFLGWTGSTCTINSGSPNTLVVTSSCTITGIFH
jgi:hypothetical protein